MHLYLFTVQGLSNVDAGPDEELARFGLRVSRSFECSEMVCAFTPDTDYVVTVICSGKKGRDELVAGASSFLFAMVNGNWSNENPGDPFPACTRSLQYISVRLHCI